MTTCPCCRKEKDATDFKKGEKTMKKCIDCRNQAKEWRDNNKERISLYNKMTVKNQNNEKETKTIIYAKKTNEDTWKEYDTQLAAATALNLHTPNINKVIKGHLKTTGGYEFKIETISKQKGETLSWDQIKQTNNIIENVKGKPSKHRILHETRNDIVGKCCCNCKEWKELTQYNNTENHWDNLRNDCKDCLSEWRTNNRKQLNTKQLIYEKNRRATDPGFKIIGILRSRLGNALKRKNAKKSQPTLELTGCEINFLKGYLEGKFAEGMSWENHGDWHIDHIRPCCNFDLTIEEEQKKCFHYTNLQPLWAQENLSKGGKYEAAEEVDKIISTKTLKE